MAGGRELEQENLVALFEGTCGRVRADPHRRIETLVRTLCRLRYRSELVVRRPIFAACGVKCDNISTSARSSSDLRRARYKVNGELVNAVDRDQSAAARRCIE